MTGCIAWDWVIIPVVPTNKMATAVVILAQVSKFTFRWVLGSDSTKKWTQLLSDDLYCLDGCPMRQ